MEVIEEKLHPALRRELPIDLEYNTFFDCEEAALAYGYDTFWSADREAKEGMIAHIKARKVYDNILAWESHELAVQEAKHKHG